MSVIVDADAPNVEVKAVAQPTPDQISRMNRIVRKFCRVLDHEKATVPEAMAALGTVQQALFAQLQTAAQGAEK